ncbi:MULTISPECIES: hypothetical protein [unclassified Cupriavidus]|uniref:hypothetical protein n=1 Tax=unclassified Cupriavidus TaxID=2640874 RepID=UPI001C001846|nr:MULTISPECIES: hypothetical protein [unclassified Cupriavidus]MCA3183922.1 hypothetical protein [Cupriavidus sp.]MCA3194315.1 hypothetical protein [Cupriavidus sp.]MCA3200423.1 hypothetical protein [Cupriavidus sp.]MCA3233705.1 hypothetical protein [Cupriavidus sp.]QWE95340.1 hypothetical protein KLP38_05440 [Cupriavidus sp. EM10]
MKEFRSLSDFADHLTRLAAAAPVVTNHMTEQAAQKVEKIAKAEIGHYQPSVGPFPAWAQLQPDTETEKNRLGYKLNAPLERTGEMRNSISHVTADNESVVGSNDQKLVWHEEGTAKIPPRPVLGPAAIRGMADMQPRFALTVAAWLSGRSWRKPRIK